MIKTILSSFVLTAFLLTSPGQLWAMKNKPEDPPETTTVPTKKRRVSKKTELEEIFEENKDYNATLPIFSLPVELFIESVGILSYLYRDELEGFSLVCRHSHRLSKAYHAEIENFFEEDDVKDFFFKHLTNFTNNYIEVNFELLEGRLKFVRICQRLGLTSEQVKDYEKYKSFFCSGYLKTPSAFLGLLGLDLDELRDFFSYKQVWFKKSGVSYELEEEVILVYRTLTAAQVRERSEALINNPHYKADRMDTAVRVTFLGLEVNDAKKRIDAFEKETCFHADPRFTYPNFSTAFYLLTPEQMKERVTAFVPSIELYHGQDDWNWQSPGRDEIAYDKAVRSCLQVSAAEIEKREDIIFKMGQFLLSAGGNFKRYWEFDFMQLSSDQLKVIHKNARNLFVENISQDQEHFVKIVTSCKLLSPAQIDKAGKILMRSKDILARISDLDERFAVIQGYLRQCLIDEIKERAADI